MLFGLLCLFIRGWWGVDDCELDMVVVVFCEFFLWEVVEVEICKMVCVDDEGVNVDFL